VDFQLLSSTFTRLTNCAGGLLKSKETIRPPWSTLSPFAQPGARLPKAFCPAWSTFAQSVLPSLERVCPAWSTALVLIWKTVRGRKWGSGDARGTATTHVVSVGHKNGRNIPSDDTIDSYSAPFQSVRFLLPLYYSNTTGRYRADISTTTPYLSITFHHPSDAINKASRKANLLTEASGHSYEHSNTAPRSNSHDHRPSSTASGYSVCQSSTRSSPRLIMSRCAQETWARMPSSWSAI
jgi:hypothetical protein